LAPVDFPVIVADFGSGLVAAFLDLTDWASSDATVTDPTTATADVQIAIERKILVLLIDDKLTIELRYQSMTGWLAKLMAMTNDR
jgi:hypothetical protein